MVWLVDHCRRELWRKRRTRKSTWLRERERERKGKQEVIWRFKLKLFWINRNLIIPLLLSLFPCVNVGSKRQFFIFVQGDRQPNYFSTDTMNSHCAQVLGCWWTTTFYIILAIALRSEACLLKMTGGIIYGHGRLGFSLFCDNHYYWNMDIRAHRYIKLILLIFAVGSWVTLQSLWTFYYTWANYCNRVLGISTINQSTYLLFAFTYC